MSIFLKCALFTAVLLSSYVFASQGGSGGGKTAPNPTKRLLDSETTPSLPTQGQH